VKLIDIIDSTPIPYGYRFSFLTNFFREPVLRKMEKEFGLIRPELTVLICLNSNQTCTSKDICEITEQPSNTVSRAVGSLEKKGHISRTTDEKRTGTIELHIRQIVPRCSRLEEMKRAQYWLIFSQNNRKFRSQKLNRYSMFAFKLSN